MKVDGSSLGSPRWWLCAGAVAGILIFAAVADVSAQADGANPGDTESEPAKPIKLPQPGGTKAVDIKPWSLRFGVNEVLEDNVQLTSGGGGDLGSRVDVGVGRDVTFRGGQIRVVADAGQLLYQQAKNLNQLTYGVGVNTTYLVTRRLTWRVSEFLTSNYAQDTRVLTDVGLILPRVLTRSNSASTELLYDLSRQTQIRASLAAQTVSFASAELTGASNVVTTVRLDRLVGRSQSVGINWGQTIASTITGDIQGLLGTWRGTFGRGVTLNAAGGVRPYKLEGRSGYQFAPALLVGIDARLTPTVTVSGNYERAVEQAYGFSGTHLAHRLLASSTVGVGRRVTVEGSASYGLNTYPLDPNFRLTGTAESLSVAYKIVDNLTVSGLSSLWYRQDSAAPAILATRVGVSLSYGFAWR
jgi:hypothetical protein